MGYERYDIHFELVVIFSEILEGNGSLRTNSTLQNFYFKYKATLKVDYVRQHFVPGNVAVQMAADMASKSSLSWNLFSALRTNSTFPKRNLVIRQH